MPSSNKNQQVLEIMHELGFVKSFNQIIVGDDHGYGAESVEKSFQVPNLKQAKENHRQNIIWTFENFVLL